eukprot:1397456-Rhodomonas_salina.2
MRSLCHTACGAGEGRGWERGAPWRWNRGQRCTRRPPCMRASGTRRSQAARGRPGGAWGGAKS